jgi:hypothetical protein
MTRTNWRCAWCERRLWLDGDRIVHRGSCPWRGFPERIRVVEQRDAAHRVIASACRWYDAWTRKPDAGWRVVRQLASAVKHYMETLR